MSTLLPIRRSAAVVVAVAVVVLLAGCATPTGGTPTDGSVPPSLSTVTPASPEGEVVAQGTVMDVGGTVELCLGAVAESYPPQCSGIPIDGWTWDGIDGSENSGDVTWGAYAVTGTYDGDAFTVTQPPIMLALYDPMPFPDPTDGVPGETDEATLQEIQDELPHDQAGIVSSGIRDGYLWVDVVWDDGTMQDAADAEYGEGVVVVQSLLREIG